MNARAPLLSAFLRKCVREGRLDPSTAEWFDGPHDARLISQAIFARFMATAYAEGRAFERRKADREAEKTAAFFDHIQTHADRDRDRIADVQWLLNGVRLVLPKKRLDRLELPNATALSDLRHHLDRLTPQPPKDIPF